MILSLQKFSRRTKVDIFGYSENDTAGGIAHCVIVFKDFHGGEVLIKGIDTINGVDELLDPEYPTHTT